jgi:hypothetical protein
MSTPKAPSVGETGFLLEDYVPERLDVKLKPGASHRDAGRARSQFRSTRSFSMARPPPAST